MVAEPIELIAYPSGNVGRALLQSVVDDHSRIFQIPTTCDVTSGKGQRKRIGATRAGSDNLHSLLIQRCIDGLNGD